MTAVAPDGRLLESFTLPLLQQLQRWHRESVGQGRRKPVIGLNGPVGAGKSTLGRQLEALAPRFGLRLVVASIDDLYLSWPERGTRLAGNPFGVSRVPPGSHDVPLLLEALQRWRCGEPLKLPRFDKTLANGQGDRAGWRLEACDAVVLEGWLVGCRPLPAGELESVMEAAAAQTPATITGRGPEPGEALWSGRGAPILSREEWRWLPRWNGELEAYQPLWSACDGLWLLRPMHWGLPRRWRFQAEARQRRRGGGWLGVAALDALVRASLCSLPPALYQDPLLNGLPAEAQRGTGAAGEGRSVWPGEPSQTAVDGGASGWTGGERLEQVAGCHPDRPRYGATDHREHRAKADISRDAPVSDCSHERDLPTGTRAVGGHETGGKTCDDRSSTITPAGVASQEALAQKTQAAAGAGNTPEDTPGTLSTARIGTARGLQTSSQHLNQHGSSDGGQKPGADRGAGSPGVPDRMWGPPVQAVAWLDGRRRCVEVWRQPSPSLSSSATG